ncbi:hypothetical protein KUTeg_000742 [Tegillarca granosa]|uniref:Lipid droplet-associated hydrolase n=1 Tax=Tegillarca granosa TaxID=220873 RepID=A0ABQ9G1J6_TEGGR|nr:hypothetical protein KUTeg_000742 [Tegillarca granosa]
MPSLQLSDNSTIKSFPPVIRQLNNNAYPPVQISMEEETEKHSEFVQIDGVTTHLYKITGWTIPVWTLGHAGHVSVPDVPDKLAEEKASYTTCTLDGQIKHKLTFINKFVPKDVKLIFIGHSIGCYMILKLLDELDSHHVLRCFMLFPTIERMAESPKGEIATPMLRYLRWLGILVIHFLSYLSPHVQYRMILWYFKNRKVPNCIYNACMSLFDPFCVGNVMYMANQEMQVVKELDEDLVHKHLSKISFYYGQSDHWCPQEYYYDMRMKFPHGDFKLCDKGHEHAYVIESSEEMAHTVWSKFIPVFDFRNFE